MDTVADTLTTEDYAAHEEMFYPAAEDCALYEQAFNPPKTNDELHYLAEARRKLEGRKAYYTHPDLIDFLMEDTRLMHGLFSDLDGFSFSFKRIFFAVVYYLLHANEDKEEKGKTVQDLFDLMEFHHGLSGSRVFISEKAFYYESFLDELEETSLRNKKE